MSVNTCVASLARQLAVLLSVFSSQMQAHSQGLWVLCAEMGVAWHILGAGGLPAVAISLAKIVPFYWPSDSSNTVIGPVFGYWLSCSPRFPAKCRLIAKGCGFFVPKWVWLGIS